MQLTHKILSLFQGQLGRDPRPTKMATLAQSFGTLTVCAASVDTATDWQGINFIPLPGQDRTQKVLRRTRLGLRQFSQELRQQTVWAQEKIEGHGPFDLILCHDAHLLPLACALRHKNGGRTRILADLREFYPRQFENNTLWRMTLAPYYEHICNTYLPQVDVALTVSPGLAAEYKKKYQCECFLLPSYALRHELQPRPTQGHPIRCIHHGASNPGRKLENMIEAIALLDGQYSLDLMLVSNNSGYVKKLRTLAAKTPWVQICDPVPMPKIVTTLHQYDMGIFLLEPNTFNHKHTWPNKLFEFIQARLGVAVSPVPDMAGLVEKYKVGVVAQDFSVKSFAQTLKEPSPAAIDAFKNAAHIAADDLCWEKNEIYLTNIIPELLNN